MMYNFYYFGNISHIKFFIEVNMQNSKLKNSIVLRGMASNVVDEAIVILKPHIKIKKMEHIKNCKEKSVSKNFIIKEAENVIIEYVNKIDKEKTLNDNKKLINRIRKLQIINILFFIIMTVLVIFNGNLLK